MRAKPCWFFWLGRREGAARHDQALLESMAICANECHGSIERDGAPGWLDSKFRFELVPQPIRKELSFSRLFPALHRLKIEAAKLSWKHLIRKPRTLSSSRTNSCRTVERR